MVKNDPPFLVNFLFAKKINICSPLTVVKFYTVKISYMIVYLYTGKRFGEKFYYKNFPYIMCALVHGVVLYSNFTLLVKLMYCFSSKISE